MIIQYVVSEGIFLQV